MKVAVVGGGVVGLFAARSAAAAGAEVTVFEPGPLGAGSIHAAGIIEPTTAYRTNTVAFLRRVVRLWRSRTCTFRSVDPRWLLESARQLERPPLPGAEEALLELSRSSVGTYDAMARARDDFDYAYGGLLERFDDPKHFAEQTAEALGHRATAPVEVRDGERAMFFPQVRWLHTERFVERMRRELTGVLLRREAASGVTLDGRVLAGGGTDRYDAVIVAVGVGCRRLGVPLTGVRGYGWHVRLRRPVERATIHVDRGIAVVPFADGAKVTGGWDFDLSTSPGHVAAVLSAIRKVAEIEEVLDFREGARPCTPDGLPTVGRSGAVVVATGGFRLGWSFGPGMGRHAARLALGEEQNDPFLARFATRLRPARW